MRNSTKTIVLLTTLTLLLVYLGSLVGGITGPAVALVLAIALNVGAYGFSDRVALRLASASEVEPEDAPELHRIVEHLARVAGVPKPRVAVVESSAANAFATGRDPAHATVVVTMGIVSALDRDELAAAIAHELAHVRNRDTLSAGIVASIAGGIITLAYLAEWPPFRGVRHADDDGELDQIHPGRFGSDLPRILLTPLAAKLVRLAISRTREFEADAVGAQILGDPLLLATALEKLEAANRRTPFAINPGLAHQFIVQPFFEDGMADLFNTHPPIADRVRRLHAFALHGSTASLVPGPIR